MLRFASCRQINPPVRPSVAVLFCYTIQMSSLFGKKKLEEKTVAIVDIENSSVAAALVQLSQEEPKLFAEKRTFLSIPQRLHGENLLHTTIAAAQELLLHVSEVAARMRMHRKLALMGDVQQAVVFFGPPWAEIDTTSSGSVQVNAPRVLTQELRSQIGSVFGDVETSFHSFATAAARIAQRSVPDEPYLLCTITGEITELTLAQEGRILARATLPVGLYTLLRTLTTHGGLSQAEAYSALKLQFSYLKEPFDSVGEHFSNALYHGLEDMVASLPTRNVFVLAHEPNGEWFAQAIVSDPKVATLFKDGGVVRALRPAHLSPLLAAHATHPDLFLMLEALFVDVRHGV